MGRRRWPASAEGMHSGLVTGAGVSLFFYAVPLRIGTQAGGRRSLPFARVLR